MSRDIPIIFSAPMVRALRDGRKTMTRRMAWHPTKATSGFPEGTMRATTWQNAMPGDRLWVREACSYINNAEFGKPSYWEYRADTDGKCFAGEWPEEERDNPDRPRWRPAIHMPRAASRLTLVVTSMMIEPLSAISAEDAIAEGCKIVRDHCYVFEGTGYDKAGLCHSSPITAFSILWDDLHGDGAWSADPSVVALSFKVFRKNIDAMETRAAA